MHKKITILSITGILLLPLPSFAQLVTDTASSLTGTEICKTGFYYAQCRAWEYQNDENLAFQGNGFAQEAVSYDVIPNYGAIHSPEFINDGHYGNGSSWISWSANSWVKIDLGRTVLVDSIRFGRDRTIGYNDRDPISIKVEVALTDEVYANGNDTNDSIEYIQVLDEAIIAVNYEQTLKASFPPVEARFIKVFIGNPGAAIDEIEVSGPLAIDVDVDIKPNSEQNSINVCSKGTVPVAILGAETFNVYDIDTSTLTFAEAHVKVVGKKDPTSLCNTEYVNEDAWTDLICHFVTIDLNSLNGTSSTATVSGELTDGAKFNGEDSVYIVKDNCD